MSGNKAGGLKTVAKIKAKDPDYYKKLGSIGGKASSGPDYQAGGPKASGFASMTPERRRELGAMGGKMGKRQKNTNSLTLRRNASTPTQGDETSMQPNPAML